ncbi:hypothetical protein [Paenisporosarcina cavernae]|uniref:Uncharacterized protein n=1 Tax=Paenisporosarcina cavernae TaxID=2320858 RepID=A0A385YRP6_9BACL|nr:hypothetical protein [Paenisporosarcina cavernae]AYC28418.1 hypothetical protein D3873_00485 [Paenisporosarcina cavernae]
MNDFRVLRIMDVFRKLFLIMGIDYDIMRKILQMKLVMDDRRVPTIFEGEKSEKESKNFIKSLGVYALYGLILIPFIVLQANYMISLSFVFGITLFILLTTMISDYSSVLLDLRDKTMLNTKPVNNRTIQAAKTIHIFLYIVAITGAFVGIPVVVSLFRHGPIFASIFLTALMLISLFVIVLTAFLYLLVLKFFDGERLKDIINYTQIILSVGVFLGYQLISRSFNFSDAGFNYQFDWWNLFIPAFWFAAPFEWLLGGNTSNEIKLLSAFAVIIPLLSIVVYVKMMASFEKNIQKLAAHSTTSKKKIRSLNDLLTPIVNRSKEERALYRFASFMMEKDRDFKLKAYPGVALTLFIPLIFIANEMSFRTLEGVSEGKGFLIIYISNFLMTSIISFLQFSGNYRASWIFQTVPLERVTTIYNATYKAFLTKFYLPIFLVLSICFTWIFSVSVIPHLIIAFLSGIAQLILVYRLSDNERFPFSRSFKTMKEDNTAKTLLLSLLIGPFVIVHYIILAVPYGVPIYLSLLVVLVVVGWKGTFSALRTAR